MGIINRFLPWHIIERWTFSRWRSTCFFQQLHQIINVLSVWLFHRTEPEWAMGKRSGTPMALSSMKSATKKSAGRAEVRATSRQAMQQRLPSPKAKLKLTLVRKAIGSMAFRVEKSRLASIFLISRSRQICANAVLRSASSFLAILRGCTKTDNAGQFRVPIENPCSCPPSSYLRSQADTFLT